MLCSHAHTCPRTQRTHVCTDDIPMVTALTPAQHTPVCAREALGQPHRAHAHSCRYTCFSIQEPPPAASCAVQEVGFSGSLGGPGSCVGRPASSSLPVGNAAALSQPWAGKLPPWMQRGSPCASSTAPRAPPPGSSDCPRRGPPELPEAWHWGAWWGPCLLSRGQSLDLGHRQGALVSCRSLLGRACQPRASVWVPLST